MHNNVLYRKYRPRMYEQVVGQQINLQILKNIVINDEKVHALLFCGTRGTGKTTLAKIFAKSLLCHNFDQKSDLCGQCEQCLKKENENFSIIEIDAASNNGVDEVRNIRENIEIGTDSGKKIYIIDEVHMFSKSAFNALLKTIEEPPENVYFILATTEQDKIPDTILSRCLKLDFKLNNKKELFDYFKLICKHESLELTDEAIELVVHTANGSIRDGLSILEKIKMYNGQENQQMDNKIVGQIIGIIPIQEINAIVKAVTNNDPKEIKQLISQISEQSFSLSSFLEQLIIALENTKINYKIKEKVFELYLKLNQIHSNVLFFIKLTDALILNQALNNTAESKSTEVVTQEQTVQVIEVAQLDNYQLDEIDRIIELQMEDILNIATKQDKNTAQNKFEKLKNYRNQLEYVQVINCINEKCEIVAASANGIILTATSKPVVQFLEDNKNKLNKLLSNVYTYKLSYHILEHDKWLKIREEYIQKIQLKKQIEQARKDLLEVFNDKK